MSRCSLFRQSLAAIGIPGIADDRIVDPDPLRAER